MAMDKNEVCPRLTQVPSLDGLRGLAIALVLATHTTSVFGNPFGGLPGHVLHFRHTGVDRFFVLSGFLITCILLDTRGCRGYLLSFYARRRLRIGPLYCLVFAGVIGVLAPPCSAAGSTTGPSGSAGGRGMRPSRPTSS